MPRASLRTICAFASDIDSGGGGYLVIGVEEENGGPVHFQGGTADLPGFQTEYRNRRIGDFLKETQLTEEQNTKLRKILHALERNGSPEPVFETAPERLSFCITHFIHPQVPPSREIKDGTRKGAPSLRTERVQLILSAAAKVLRS